MLALVPLHAECDVPTVSTSSPPQKNDRNKDAVPPNHINGIYPYVSVTPARISSGAQMRISVGLRKAAGASAFIVNPFLWEEYYLPGNIIVKSHDDRIRLALLRPRDAIPDASAPDLTVDSWLWSRIGREFTFKVECGDQAQVTTEGNERTLIVPPGEYMVYSEYSHWVTAPLEVGVKGKAACAGVRVPRLLPHKVNDAEHLSYTEMNAIVVRSPRVIVTVMDKSADAPTVTRIRETASTAIQYILRPEKISGRAGDRVELEVELSNRSGNTTDVCLYRGLVNKLIVTQEQDGVEHEVGELWMPFSWLDSRPLDCWVRLPPDGYVTKTIAVTIGHVFEERQRWLRDPTRVAPGRYNVQLIVHQKALARRPAYADMCAVHPSADWSLLQPKDDENWLERRTMQRNEWDRIPLGPIVARSNGVILEIGEVR
jgi:hypothetical protein